MTRIFIVLIGAIGFPAIAEPNERLIEVSGIVTNGGGALPDEVRFYQVGRPLVENAVEWKGVGGAGVDASTGEYQAALAVDEGATRLIVAASTLLFYESFTETLQLSEGVEVYSADLSIAEPEVNDELDFILRVLDGESEVAYRDRVFQCFIAHVSIGEGRMYLVDSSYFGIRGNRFVDAPAGEYVVSCSLVVGAVEHTVKSANFGFSLPLTDESGQPLPESERIIDARL